LSAEDGPRILHIVWNYRVMNAEIRKRNIMAVAFSLKRKRGGHVARMDQLRWAHATSVWAVKTGKRRNG
jgi:hypothetical protein